MVSRFKSKEEVYRARPLIGKVLRLLKVLFPRHGPGNEYNFSKMDGMIKFQFYNQQLISIKVPESQQTSTL
jgi:hypothetical protein